MVEIHSQNDIVSEREEPIAHIYEQHYYGGENSGKKAELIIAP